MTKVESCQSGTQIVVTYTLDRQADISVCYSTDGGQSYSDKLQFVSGDVGRNVSPGRNRLIWDVLAEVNEFSGSNIVFRVEASQAEVIQVDANGRDPSEIKEELGAKWLLLLQLAYPGTQNMGDLGDGSNTSLDAHLSFGLLVGRVKKFGWYAQGLSSFGLRDCLEDGLKVHYNSVTAGALANLGSGWHIYAGGGCAWRNLKYYYFDEAVDEVKEKISTSCFAANAGLVFRWERLAINAGAILTFDRGVNYAVNVGIGYCL